MLTRACGAGVCEQHGWPLPAEDATCRQAVQQQCALASQIASGYEFVPCINLQAPIWTLFRGRPPTHVGMVHVALPVCAGAGWMPSAQSL